MIVYALNFWTRKDSCDVIGIFTTLKKAETARQEMVSALSLDEPIEEAEKDLQITFYTLDELTEP